MPSRDLESYRCKCGHNALFHPDSREIKTYPCGACSCERFTPMSHREWMRDYYFRVTKPKREALRIARLTSAAT